MGKIVEVVGLYSVQRDIPRRVTSYGPVIPLDGPPPCDRCWTKRSHRDYHSECDYMCLNYDVRPVGACHCADGGRAL